MEFNDRRPANKITTKAVIGHPGKVRSVMIDGQHAAHMWPYGNDGEFATDLDHKYTYGSAKEAKEAIRDAHIKSPPSVRAYRASQQLTNVTKRP